MRELIWFGNNVQPDATVLPFYRLDRDYVPVQFWVKREVTVAPSAVLFTPFDVTDDGTSIFTKLPSMSMNALELIDEQIADNVAVMVEDSIVRLVGSHSIVDFTVILTLEEV